jgi:predicted Zn-dependent protease
MSHEHDDDFDEQRLTELLRATNADAPPPDAGVLDTLRQRSADAFAESHRDRPAESPAAEKASTSPVPPAPQQNHTMLALALRGTLALSALVALFLAWLTPWNTTPVSGAIPFSKILGELRAAQSLQLRVVKEGREAEVWVRAPGLVRWQESPQRYQIAAGSRLWKIDEEANTIAETDSPWFLDPDRQIDLVGLLDVGVTDASPLLTARPIDRRVFDGRDCFVYLAKVRSPRSVVSIEAFADATTNRLLQLTAWEGDLQELRKAAELIDQKPPLAELRLIAINVAVDDDKFAVAKSLTEDGRIGKIAEAQGIVGIRPLLSRRWTPIASSLLLKPGDWLRTELRGANAVKVSLSSEVELTLGPGTLVECISATKSRLHTGEVQVSVGQASRLTLPQNDVKPSDNAQAARLSYELLAPRDGSRIFKPGVKQLVRVDRDEMLADVPQKPLWLAGFEGSSNNESLGSLIVNLPDGRNEPLTVGYHKVNVEIRDQIARTTIEESFANHTDARLEGVFYFPLPQDASISGFGMWIGNDLVEADVVEKQRAREIYETILREMRDPGLLEWTSGNLFKARVFPIEPHAEKRVKIVYTQVLPLRANRYRYAYGLRSDLLRTKPLRELSLTVMVNSALPLRAVTCPTHTARVTVGRPSRAVGGGSDGPEGPSYNSAQVEFAAQEYTPSRDFEVVCEIDGRQSDVVVIPHRRGDDGYLLVQVTPPAADGNWQREVLPDGQPLKLVLVCDTSGSMDSEKRKQQTEFVSTVLASLGPDDRFQIAAADVGTVWLSTEPLAANADNVAKARSFLDDRLSLGWTNLDRAFDDVLKKSPADSHVIYIGDGIVSAGDTDPAAFVKRLAALVANQASGGREPPEKPRVGETPGAHAPGSPSVRSSLHAVTVGNTTESVVLKGIASVGGGSVRSIGGEQTPLVVARELLNELAQPGLRDLNVEFRGLKVAAVYPGRSPNVAAGTQQILVGRYLPEGKDQQGEIIVTGKRGAEKVRYAARVNFKDAEDGNSFIPRLWARAHLDHLLAQGQSSAVRDDIIALSEEFHIITPYTSLLVLETDADRERFGVKRRYEMRDGERFFAEGRANANFELLQQQMKRAGDWRLGLRRQVLASLVGLGRDPRAFQQQVQMIDQLVRAGTAVDYNLPMSYSASGPMSGPVGGPWGFASDSRSAGGAGEKWLGDISDLDGEWAGRGIRLGELRDTAERESLGFGVEESLSLGLPEAAAAEPLSDVTPRLIVDEETFEDAPGPGLAALKRRADFDFGRFNAFGESELSVGQALSLEAVGGFGGRSESMRGGVYRQMAPARPMSLLSKSVSERFYYERGYNQPNYTSWLNTVFPTLDAPPRPRKPEPKPKDPEGWSPAALELSRSLLRMESLLKMDGGIELRAVSESFDPRWNRRSARNSDLMLYSPTAWLARPLDADDHTLVSYCDAKERGVFSLALLLGRTRASVAQELMTLPRSLSDLSLVPVHESYPGYQARVEPAGENRSKLIITLLPPLPPGGEGLGVRGPRAGSRVEQHYLIDTEKHALVKHELFDDGKLTGATSYEDFVQVGGSWWARKVTTTDAKGRKLVETTFDVQARPAAQFAKRMADELAAEPKVQFLRLPFAKLSVARQKVADGSASFDDRIAMILHNASLQQWDEMWKHVDAAEKLAVDKPGVRWMRTILLATIRRNQEARLRLLDEGRTIAANKQQDDLHLAEFILSQIYNLSSWPEYLDIVQILKPVYERHPAELDALSRWEERWIQSVAAVGRYEEALALRRAKATAAPWQLDWQTDYARRLSQAGQPDAARAWLQKELDRPVERSSYEDETLRAAITDLHRSAARWADLLKFTTEWIARKPDSWSYNGAYAQHLSALIFNDQLDAANAHAESWLREARIDGKLAPDARARLETAINFANGSAYNLSVQRPDERWFEPLADTIRFFLRHKHHSDIALRGIGNHYFQQSDVVDRLRGEFLSLLQTDLASLTPAQINMLVGWAISGRMELREPINGRRQLQASEVPSDVWKKIAGELRPRWERAEDKTDKHLLGESLRTIYANRFNDTELLPFLRERIATAHADHKLSYIATLFDTLLGRPWTEEIEAEAFQRLRELSNTPEPADRLVVQLPALHRLVDAMIAQRIALAEQQLQDQGELNKLTRKELAAKKVEFRKAARIGVAARLATEAAKEGEKSPLAGWLRIEQSWLDVQLDQRRAEVESLCWQILGEVPPKGDSDADEIEDASEATARQEFFDSLLRQRAFVTVMYLASRRKAEPATIDRVLKYDDAGIGHRGDVAAAWRATKFQLLIALDRPDDLDCELRAWIRADVSTSPWRQMLARLVAERGKIDEAIQLVESAEKDKLLTAADYRLLSDWYLVSNSRAAYERSRVESFKQMPENYLSNMLYQVSNRWMRRDARLPSELDEDTLFAVEALFEKSAQPENYLWQHSNLYGATRDFRLLRMLPDAVLGRSPQQVYRFLQTLQSAALGDLRNEAAADEVISRIKTLRERDRTPTDLRALDLLEALIERKSSEVLNQPGPHVDASVAALQRAFRREWSDGEPRMMSNFLYQLGGLPNEKLKAEQLRELRELQRQAPANSRDHLFITTDLCNLLFWNYTQREPALREMEIEVRAYTQANDGLWPHVDNELLGRYVSMLEGANRHAVGETALQTYAARQANDEQRKWLNDRLMSLYNHALEHDGAVSPGTGRAKLFVAIVALTRRELDAAPDENVRYNLVTRLVSTLDIGRRHQIAETPEAVRQFAFEVMPALLKRQQGRYRNTATAPMHVIVEALGPKFALRYAVERMEQYPQRLEVSWDNSWNAFGYELARRREESANARLDIAELAPRVLVLAIKELKRELRTGEARHHSIYYRNNNHFWQEKAGAFAKAAEEVLAERRTSGRRVLAVANYLWHGLGLYPRAIEIMLVAHRDGLLEESSQDLLVTWLHDQKRFAESIPIIEPLVTARPDSMHYRTRLMTAYFHSQRPEQLAELVKQIESHFHEAGRWTEGNIAEFAKGCLSCGLAERAVGYFNEAIALRQRANPGGGLGDVTLSDWYQHLAQAQSALGHTRAAVDAASAAIVCWGPRHDQRRPALAKLSQVLNNAKDLDGYVQYLDEESAKTGQDSPILRKAIGQSYQSRGQLDKAIVQFQLAVALQPNDKEVHQALIACYDSTQNKAQAMRQLLKLVDFDRHDLALYQQLAERLKGDEAEAERAATSIVEAAPTESENHAALAELRQKQNRWDEAVPHWERVAELRRLEPIGLLKLAEAQLHQKRWVEARQSIEKLQRTEWPARFNDVRNQTRQLQERLPK